MGVALKYLFLAYQLVFSTQEFSRMGAYLTNLPFLDYTFTGQFNLENISQIYIGGLKLYGKKEIDKLSDRDVLYRKR